MVFCIQHISTHSQRSRCFSSTVVSSCQSPRRCSLEATTKSNWYCLADARIQISLISQWFVRGISSNNSLECFPRCLKNSRNTFYILLHGSLNVPIEHHPTIRYMVYNGYYLRWCPIYPKWDSYQPLVYWSLPLDSMESRWINPVTLRVKFYDGISPSVAISMPYDAMAHWFWWLRCRIYIYTCIYIYFFPG